MIDQCLRLFHNDKEHFVLSKNYSFLAILISSFNFLFFLLIHKNIAYHYLLRYVSNYAENVFFALIIFLKLCFSGFALGMLLFSRINKKFPSINIYSILNFISYITLLSVLINYIEIHYIWLVLSIVFFIIFSSGFFYGLAYAIIIEKIGQQYHKILFYLLIGSLIGVIIFNFFLAYLPFFIVYFILFFIIQLLLLQKFYTISRVLRLIVIFMVAIFLFVQPNFGQISTVPGSFKHVLKKMGPGGILDVLYSPADGYVIWSDKRSPSTIAVKGRIERVQENAKIPYLVKDYNKSLLIGVGGGQDLVAGLYYGTKNITAVEIDSQRINLMKKEFKDYSKDLFFDKRIKIMNTSGRAFLRANTEKFDLIGIQRPWTRQISNAFVYSPSSELFTVEALDIYLNALQEKGIIYWGLPLGGDICEIQNEIKIPYVNNLSAFSAIKNKINILRNNLLIFLPYNNDSFIGILISKDYDLTPFYSAYKNKYSFIYYPTMDIQKGLNSVVDYLFFDVGENLKGIDKQLVGLFNAYRLKMNLCIILAFLVALPIFEKLKFKNVSYSIYFYLGIGYEVILFFSIIWLSFFISNFTKLLPIVTSIYFLFGSIGYLHSVRVNKRVVFIICILLPAIFLLLWYNNIFLWGHKVNSTQVVFVLLLFSLVSYLITFPFGYLIRHAKNIYSAFSIDYIGSLCSFFVIFLLPNLDYLLFIGIFIYTWVGILIICNSLNLIKKEG